MARGAAYADQHAFPKAVSDFQTALGDSPGLLSTAFSSSSGCYAKLQQYNDMHPDHVHQTFSANAWHSLSAASLIRSTDCIAEIEPGHVNASKYLRVTEQHMTQLGIPIAGSLQPVLDSAYWNPIHEAHEAAEHSAAMQPAVHPTDTGVCIVLGQCFHPHAVAAALFPVQVALLTSANGYSTH